MWLVRNGVREEIALELSDAERLARCVIFGRFEGNDFDWVRMRFKERS